MKITALSLLLFTFPCRAQVSDNFNDGDFTANPSWTGSTTEFTVNSSFEAQTSNSIAATSYLSTAQSFNPGSTYEWQVRLKIATAPSASNFAKFYLTSGTGGLPASDGFFLQFGESGSTDAIRLKRTVGGVETEICGGPAGQIASSFNVRVRVLRYSTGDWTLYVDPSGGTAFTEAATGTDDTILSSGFFGFLATYTAGNANKYYFDDVYSGPEIVDTQAPSLLSASFISPASVDLLFSEPLNGSAISSPTNYSLNPSVSVASATQDGSDASLVHLTLSTALTNGTQYYVIVNSAQDLSGNTSSNLQTSFTYLVSDSASRGDLIINEFMCDPSPPVGLPEFEYIEIYNKSAKYFDLTGWKLGDSSENGTIINGWIAPGEYKILCSTASQSSFPDSHPVTSFPNLNNAEGAIILYTPDLRAVDQLYYTGEWYHDESKTDGGYSIERINPDDPCSDIDNWRVSEDISGGTPGVVNSVFDPAPDLQSASIVTASASSPNNVLITFSEAVDSLSVTQSVFSSNPALTVSGSQVAFQGDHYLTLSFAQDLVPSQVYTYTLAPVADCWNNASDLTGTFALPENPGPDDLVINELLFDPGTGGSDFVEVYNKTSKILDLKNCYFASIHEDTIGNVQLIQNNVLLRPHDYMVFTNDTNWVKAQFSAFVAGRFSTQILPPLNNDSSTVFLFNADSVLLDKVPYTADWQLSLLDDTENKTLERISPDAESTTAGNWHTAAESIGFGTPGRINSQYDVIANNGDFGTATEVFSPDNDGYQDVMQFYYTMEQPDMIATVSVYDSYGRLVKNLKKSELLGTSGNFNWDGVNESQQKSVVGIYIAVFEAFSQNGGANFSKRTAFTLAGKLD